MRLEPNGSICKNLFCLILFVLISFLCCTSKEGSVPSQMAQFPSPMVENIRTHERISDKEIRGLTITLDSVLTKPVEIYVPDSSKNTHFTSLLIHFHGLSYVPKYAVYHSGHPIVLAVVNLGSGSSVYEHAFKSADVFDTLIGLVGQSVS